jgi:hypothetical protein
MVARVNGLGLSHGAKEPSDLGITLFVCFFGKERVAAVGFALTPESVL